MGYIRQRVKARGRRYLGRVESASVYRLHTESPDQHCTMEETARIILSISELRYLNGYWESMVDGSAKMEQRISPSIALDSLYQKEHIE
jgi:hypothetical protein